MSRFAVTAASDTVQLHDRKGEASFTVSNTGTDPDRVMAKVVVSETETPAAKPDWFTIDEPLRTIDPKGHDQYRVSVTVPADVGAGTYGFRLRAYSADQPPEETAETSKRVTFTIEPVAPPPPPWWKRWWFWAAVVGVLALIAVLFVLLKPDDEAKVEAATFVGPSGLVRCAQICVVDISWTDTGADGYRIEVRDITEAKPGIVALSEILVPGTSLELGVNLNRSYRAFLTTVDGGKNLEPVANTSFDTVFGPLVDPPISPPPVAVTPVNAQP